MTIPIGIVRVAVTTVLLDDWTGTVSFSMASPVSCAKGCEHSVSQPSPWPRQCPAVEGARVAGSAGVGIRARCKPMSASGPVYTERAARGSVCTEQQASEQRVRCACAHSSLGTRNRGTRLDYQHGVSQPSPCCWPGSPFWHNQASMLMPRKRLTGTYDGDERVWLVWERR